MAYSHILPYDLPDNLFHAIDSDWMLITSKDPETGKCNMMTASWGGTGILWNKPVAFLFVRPQRYTYQLLEKNNSVTLSFFDMQNTANREILKFCGTASGYHCDKLAQTGLTAIEEEDYVWFSESRLTFKCQKCYSAFLEEQNFCSSQALSCYPQKDFHKLYICEIKDILQKN